MYRRLTPLLLAIFLATSGCASSTLPTMPEGQPTLVGPIVAQDLQFGAMQGTRNIHVRPEAEECGIVFAIDERTTIGVRTPGGSVRRGTLDDLTIGRTVRAWARGVILESCPGQTTAAAVEVLE